MKKLKKKLLKDASEKPVRRFLQVDAESRDEMYGGTVEDLRRTSFPVRVQILEGTTKDQAIGILANVMYWLALDYEELAAWAAERPNEVPPPFVEDDIPL